MECWHHFDAKFVPDDKYIGAATTSYGVDSNWYTDIGVIATPPPHHNLVLKNVFYAPEATKNLISIHKLVVDNYAFLEYHLDFFYYQGSGHEEISA
jgi:hypothetical protein